MDDDRIHFYISIGDKLVVVESDQAEFIGPLIEEQILVILYGQLLIIDFVEKITPFDSRFFSRGIGEHIAYVSQKIIAARGSSDQLKVIPKTFRNPLQHFFKLIIIIHDKGK